MTSNPTITADIAAKIQVLIDGGATLQDALAKVLEEVMTPVQVPYSANGARRDTIAYLGSLRDIPEVRRVKKIAYAKISKSKGKPDSIARYELEIKKAEEVLNILLAEVNAAPIPWEKAMELGDSAESAFNYYFQDLKDKIDIRTDKVTKGMTRAQVKAELQTLQPSCPSTIPEILRPVLLQRVDNQDMMVITTCRKISLISKIKKAASTPAPINSNKEGN